MYSSTLRRAEHVLLEPVARGRPRADHDGRCVHAQRLARVLADHVVRERHRVLPAVVVGGRDVARHARAGTAPACRRRRRSPGTGGRRSASPARSTSCGGVEAVDALRLHQRQQPPALPEQRPDQPEPAHRDRLALQAAARTGAAARRSRSPDRSGSDRHARRRRRRSTRRARPRRSSGGAPARPARSPSAAVRRRPERTPRARPGPGGDERRQLALDDRPLARM